MIAVTNNFNEIFWIEAYQRQEESLESRLRQQLESMRLIGQRDRNIDIRSFHHDLNFNSSMFWSSLGSISALDDE